MNKSIKQKLADLFNEQRFGVIATQGKTEPYTNLVTFLTSEDFKKIYFPTSKKSKKYENLSENSRMSILIDDRGNNPQDIKKAMAVTAVGISKENKDIKIVNAFLLKHPYLKKFVNSPNSVIIEIGIEKYIIVDRFENINTIDFLKKNDSKRKN
jgi:general stress protein 26